MCPQMRTASTKTAPHQGMLRSSVKSRDNAAAISLLTVRLSEYTEDEFIKMESSESRWKKRFPFRSPRTAS
jgi:hypothetical protein